MSKPPFRETLWFKKGAVDPQPTQPLEIVEDAYNEDGTVTVEDSIALSVRTGTTQAIDPIRDVVGEISLRGDADDDQPLDAGGQLDHLVVDLKRGRFKVLAALGASAVAVVAAVLLLA